MVSLHDLRRFDSRRVALIATCVVVGAGLVVAGLNVGGDTDVGLSWSRDVLTDEGWYAAQAASVARGGGFVGAEGGYHPGALMPVVPALQRVVFGVAGVGLVGARMVSVFFFWLACFAVARLARYAVGGLGRGGLSGGGGGVGWVGGANRGGEGLEGWLSVAGVGLIATDAFLVNYGRLAFNDTAAVALMLLALVAVFERRVVVAGLFSGLAVLAKPVAVAMIPAVVVGAWGAMWVARREGREGREGAEVCSGRGAAASGVSVVGVSVVGVAAMVVGVWLVVSQALWGDEWLRVVQGQVGERVASLRLMQWRTWEITWREVARYDRAVVFSLLATCVGVTGCFLLHARDTGGARGDGGGRVDYGRRADGSARVALVTGVLLLAGLGAFVAIASRGYLPARYFVAVRMCAMAAGGVALVALAALAQAGRGRWVATGAALLLLVATVQGASATWPRIAMSEPTMRRELARIADAVRGDAARAGVRHDGVRLYGGAASLVGLESDVATSARLQAESEAVFFDEIRHDCATHVIASPEDVAHDVAMREGWRLVSEHALLRSFSLRVFAVPDGVTPTSCRGR